MPLPAIPDATVYQVIAQKGPIHFKELAFELREQMGDMSVRRKVKALHGRNLIERPSRNGAWSVKA